VLVEDGWPAAEVIETARLTLEPLLVDHAAEMTPLLDDNDLYTYIGGRPATLDELRDRYRRQSVGRSAEGDQGWLNWVVRHRASGAAAGTVQALTRRGERLSADLAWMIATGHQRQGYATGAAAGMVAWLRSHGGRQLAADRHWGRSLSMPSRSRSSPTSNSTA